MVAYLSGKTKIFLEEQVAVRIDVVVHLHGRNVSGV